MAEAPRGSSLWCLGADATACFPIHRRKTADKSCFVSVTLFYVTWFKKVYGVSQSVFWLGYP